MNWLWIGGGLLFVVAALALWYRFGNPKWVAGLAASFVTMAVNAFLPDIIKALKDITKAMPPDEQIAWNEFNRVPRDKREIAKWWKEYRKRKKAR